MPKEIERSRNQYANVRCNMHKYIVNGQQSVAKKKKYTIQWNDANKIKNIMTTNANDLDDREKFK